jgi:hypothetical protein
MSGRESGLPAYIVVDFCDGPKYIDTSCLELVKPEEEKKPEPEFKVKVCSGGLSGGGDGISGKMRFTFPDVDVNPFEEPKFKVGDTVYVEARITKINCDVKEFPYWVMLPGSHSKVCAIIDKVIKKKE